MKKLLNIFLFLTAFFAVERFCHFQTKGFVVQKILADSPFDPSLETPPLEKEELAAIDKILSQPFYFFGKGVQAYVFCSQDGTVVLKLFKHYHFFPDSPALEAFPIPSFLEETRKKVVEKRQKRMYSILSSCKIAMEDLKEETGMIYAHLNQTTHLNKTITLIDNLGIAHLINLDQVEFVLQKRAHLLTTKIDDLVKQKNHNEAKACIDALLQLIISRCHKGIANTDLLLQRNYGFIENQAVEIDIGSFRKMDFVHDPFNAKKEIFEEIADFKNWVDLHYPSLSEHLKEQINENFQAL